MTVVRARAVRYAATMCVAVAIGAATAAAAQTPEPAGALELALGGVVLGPMPLGSRSADLQRPDGRPLPLFDGDIRLGAGPGVELNLTRRLDPRWSLEVSGSWTSTPVRFRVSHDFEDAPTLTASERLFRFSAQGAALWSLASSASRDVFVRAGAGWMRELAGSSGLTRGGLIGTAGVGMKYWKGRSTPGRGRRWGVRLEGRAVLRARGVQLGAETMRVAPAVAGHLLFGF